MTEEIINSINKSIAWLDKHKKSNNIVAASKVINSLTINSYTLAEEVTQAYRLMNEAEDNYKGSLSKFVAKSKDGVAKADRIAEDKYHNLKKHWTDCKNIYKRLDMILDRIDKICDSYRQSISVIKATELKNL